MRDQFGMPLVESDSLSLGRKIRAGDYLLRLWNAYKVTSEEFDSLEKLIYSRDLESLILAEELMKQFEKKRDTGLYRVTKKTIRNLRIEQRKEILNNA